MSSTGYLIWFIAEAVVTVLVMGVAIAFASGAFDKVERERRKARHAAEEAARARIHVPAQRTRSRLMRHESESR